jgi:glutamate/tyrosine decarboxylase-like PLP-dependent enzyme
MDLGLLERELARGDVGAVVCTLGTTSTGAVDPLADIAELKGGHGFRLHVDAAYGGYFTLASSLDPATRRHFDALGRADSIAIDPHKHGLQPYGCGCVLFRDPAMGAHYKHDSPYTYFTSPDLHLGEISLECSRPGAAAVALWATHRLMPLVRGGELAAGLDRGRSAARDLHARLASDARFLTLDAPELDIVVWAVDAPRASEASRRARAIFDEAARLGLHLALARLPRAAWEGRASFTWDEPDVTCLRSCLMRPEQSSWMDAIWDHLSRAADGA